VVLKALGSAPDQRFQTAYLMARALHAAIPPAGEMEVAAWVESSCGATLRARAQRIAEIETVAVENPSSGRRNTMRIGSFFPMESIRHPAPQAPPITVRVAAVTPPSVNAAGPGTLEPTDATVPNGARARERGRRMPVLRGIGLAGVLASAAGVLILLGWRGGSASAAHAAAVRTPAAVVWLTPAPTASAQPIVPSGVVESASGVAEQQKRDPIVLSVRRDAGGDELGSPKAAVPPNMTRGMPRTPVSPRTAARSPESKDTRGAPGQGEVVKLETEGFGGRR
jgi:hypothetical protein